MSVEDVRKGLLLATGLVSLVAGGAAVAAGGGNAGEGASSQQQPGYGQSQQQPGSGGSSGSAGGGDYDRPSTQQGQPQGQGQGQPQGQSQGQWGGQQNERGDGNADQNRSDLPRNCNILPTCMRCSRTCDALWMYETNHVQRHGPNLFDSHYRPSMICHECRGSSLALQWHFKVPVSIVPHHLLTTEMASHMLKRML